MATTSAQDATVLALTPICVLKAEQQPDQLVLLKKESSWRRGNFVEKAGWVSNVNEKYRSGVASACASAVVEAMDAKPAFGAPRVVRVRSPTTSQHHAPLAAIPPLAASSPGAIARTVSPDASIT